MIAELRLLIGLASLKLKLVPIIINIKITFNLEINWIVSFYKILFSKFSLNKTLCVITAKICNEIRAIRQ